MVRTALVATGNELVYGKIQEYNNYYLSKTLFATSCEVVAHYTVGDNPEMIKKALQDAFLSADLVVITGGLGPTDDDRTIEVLQQMLHFETSVHQPGLRRMEKYFSSMERKVLPGDLKMVTVPSDGEVFDNEIGLAVGFSVPVESVIVIAMPGVPREMEYMFANKVFPYIESKLNLEKRDFMEFKTVLMREAEVNNIVGSLAIPFESVTWGITTNLGINHVLFYSKDDISFPARLIQTEMERAFGENLLLNEYNSLEKELLFRLSSLKMTLAVAESCTGGLVAKKMTDIPGSSDVFNGGIITYSNQAKKELLDVSASALSEYGAVSELVAGQMAEGARNKLGADICVSITGVAGPGGGTKEKPVGMVCFGLATPEGLQTYTEKFTADRWRNRELSAIFAMNIVRNYCSRIA